MDDFPSLPPPTHTPSQDEKNTIFNCEALEKNERLYESWLAELHQCPHPAPVGVKQLGLDDMGMDLDEEEEDVDSLDDSEEEFNGNDLVMLGDESDLMEDSSVQDNSAFNDST